MPVWRQFIAERALTDFDVVSVAMDIQGPELPRPFVEGTEDAFPTLIDADNVLGRYFGFKAIPMVCW